jgi:hypothetical protein
MGTMSNLIEFQPFNMAPVGNFDNPMTGEIFRSSIPYAEPSHFAFYPAFGPFAVAGISEVTGTAFLARLQRIFTNNDQIVSVPERPVDMGTFQAIINRNQSTAGQSNYIQPNSGVYLQPRQATVVNTVSVAGIAPTIGVYTGYDQNGGLNYGSGAGSDVNGISVGLNYSGTGC